MIALGKPVLALDTATRQAGLALYDGHSVLSESTWRAGQKHTVTLMPSLVHMLAQQSLAAAHLAGLVVALGPGSYTGLRIGLSVAKGLALARGLPIVGVPTLDTIAYSFAPLCRDSGAPPLRAVLEAGRGRYCVADYTWCEGEPRREGDYQVLSGAHLSNGVNEPTLFCGEIDSEAAQLLQIDLGNRVLMPPPAHHLRRPGFLAQLGWQRLADGQHDDPATLSPIYLRTAPVGQRSVSGAETRR